LCFCVVLYCVGRGLSDGLITRPNDLIRLRNFGCKAAKVLTRTGEPLMMMMLLTTIACQFLVRQVVFRNIYKDQYGLRVYQPKKQEIRLRYICRI
jgi:hypothetical protein